MTEDEKIKEMVSGLAVKFPNKSIAIDTKNYSYVYDDGTSSDGVKTMYIVYVEDLYTETSIKTFEDLKTKYTEIIKGEK